MDSHIPNSEPCVSGVNRRLERNTLSAAHPVNGAQSNMLRTGLRSVRRALREVLRRKAARMSKLKELVSEKVRFLRRKRARDAKYVSIMHQCGSFSSVTIFDYMLDVTYATRKEVRQDRREVMAMNVLVNPIEPQGFFGKVTESLNNAVKSTEELSKTAESVNEFISTIHGGLTPILDIFKQIKAYMKKWASPIIFGAFLIAFFVWCRQGSFPPLWFGVLGSIVGTLIGKDLWNKFCDLHPEIVFGKKAVTMQPLCGSHTIEIEPQAGFDTSALIMALISYFMLSTNVLCPQSFNTTKLLRSISFLGMIPKASDGLQRLFEWTVDASEVVLNWIRSLMSLPAIRLRDQKNAELREFVDRVYKLEQSEITAPRDVNVETAHNRMTVINGLMHQAISLRQSYYYDKNAVLTINGCQRTLVALAKPLRAAIGTDVGIVQQPVSVVLYGKPGVGKTMVLNNFSITILNQLGVLKEGAAEGGCNKLIFSKPHNSDYMEGYCGQPVYVIDDFMLKKATPGETSSGISDLMTYYSSFSTMVNMAACENKGMWPFCSKLILITTNVAGLTQVNADNVYLDMEAIQRRVDLHYEVCVRPEFRLPGSHKLDHDKFKEEMAKIPPECNLVDGYPWHVWEVFETSWLTPSENRVPGTGRCMRELIVETILKMEARAASHQLTVEVSNRLMQCKPMDIGSLKAYITPQCPEIGTLVHPPDAEFPMCSEDSFKTAEELYQEELEYVRKVNADPIFEHIDPWDGTRTIYPELQDECENVEAAKRKLEESWFTSRVSKAWIDFCDWVKDHALLSGVLVLGLGAAFVTIVKFVARLFVAAYETLKEFFFGSKIEPQSNEPPQRAAVRRMAAYPQSGTGEGEKMPLSENVYRNSFKMVVHLADGTTIPLGQVIFYKRDYCVMPGHYYGQMAEASQRGDMNNDTKILLISCRSPDLTLVMKYGHFLKFERESFDGRDLVMVRLKGLFTARDISHLVMKHEEIKRVGGQPVQLHVAKMGTHGLSERVIYSTPSVKYIPRVLNIGHLEQKESLNYMGDTVKGDCGAPLCLRKESFSGCRVLMGLHVGGKNTTYGDSYTGYATLTTSEELAAAHSKLVSRTSDPIKSELTFADTVSMSGIESHGADIVPHHVLPIGEEDEEGEVHFGTFENVGLVNKPVSAPVKTNLVETFVSREGLLEDVMPDFSLEPMKIAPYLKDGLPVFPMEEALRPYSGEVMSIDTDLISKAVHIAMLPLSRVTLNYAGRVWDDEEALKGANGSKGMPLGTSTGYPGCLKYGNKRKALGDIMEWDLEAPQVRDFVKSMNAMEKALNDGERPYFVARGFLKDELRKPGKVARYIAGTNMHYYALCRKYFGQVVSCQMKHYKECGLCPGINPYQDWEWLRDWTTQTGTKVWDGDFSGFDTSQQPELLLACLSWINQWYRSRGGTAEEDAIREILFTDLYKSKHLCGLKNQASHVVQWQRSLPSGHFLTSFINSMISMSTIVAAYIKLTGRDDFWGQCRVAVLGDDNLVGASDAVIEQFNQVSVAFALQAEFGMVYTAGRKGEALKPYLSMDEVTFLQRTFQKKNGVTVGPIRLESIYGPLLYAQRGDPSYRREVLCSNIEGALSELSLRPESEWGPGSRLLLEVASRVEYVPRLPCETSKHYFDFTCQREAPEYSK